MAPISKARKKVAKKQRSTPQRLSEARLQALIEEATMDAYGESEQRMGFEAVLSDELDLPFETEVLGVPVVVEGISTTPAEEIVAICRSGDHTQAIPVLELPLPRPRPAGWEWIEAYRRWAGG